MIMRGSVTWLDIFLYTFSMTYKDVVAASQVSGLPPHGAGQSNSNTVHIRRPCRLFATCRTDGVGTITTLPDPGGEQRFSGLARLQLGLLGVQ